MNIDQQTLNALLQAALFPCCLVPLFVVAYIAIRARFGGPDDTGGDRVWVKEDDSSPEWGKKRFPKK